MKLSSCRAFVSPKIRFALGIAACAIFALRAQATPVSTSISQSATGTLWLGNAQNPPPNPAVIVDTATVKATGNAVTPTGSVTFSVYKYPSDSVCGAPPVFQSAAQPLVNGSATIQLPAEQVGAGVLYWVVNYTSDQPTQYANSSSNCHDAISTILRASPTLSIQTSRFTATVGETDEVKVTMTGGYHPTGPVTFYVSGPNDSSCTQQTALATKPLGSDATATYWFQPTQPGAYTLTAAFARDNLNEAAAPYLPPLLHSRSQTAPSKTTLIPRARS